jgi:hypothetical protein
LAPNYHRLGGPGFFSYHGGTLVMLVMIVLMREPFLSFGAITRSTWWSWGGGFFGAIYISISILLLPRIGKWEAEKKQYAMPDNPDFEVQAKAKFKPDETLAVMCRSGHRSSASVERLAKNRFHKRLQYHRRL